MKRAPLSVNFDCRTNELIVKVGAFGDSHAMTVEELILFAAHRAQCGG